jgi:predicted alpha/beta-fold hydrolase
MQRPTFAPPRWLVNPHLQSALPSSLLRRAFVARSSAALRAASQEVVVECGGEVRLLGHYSPLPGTARGLVLMVHGWEGSAESQYVLSAAQYLYARGFEIFRLNLRDHGASHHLNPELFHSCRIAEVVGAVRSVQALYPAAPLSMVGYSLGGNFALRVAARAPNAGIQLRHVVAICPVLDPVQTLDSLVKGLWIYRRYFVSKWRKSLRKKREAWPDIYDLDELLDSRDLTDLTERLVLKYTNFTDLQSYLEGYAIVGEALSDLKVPCRIITATDDPIIPVRDLKRLAASENLEVTVSPHGGHCGFLESMSGESWADREVYATLDAAYPVAH